MAMILRTHLQTMSSRSRNCPRLSGNFKERVQMCKVIF